MTAYGARSSDCSCEARKAPGNPIVSGYTTVLSAADLGVLAAVLRLALPVRLAEVSEICLPELTYGDKH